MGAQFQAMSVKDGSRDNIRKLFEAAQDKDRYENGHSYSGGFGMADGLKFDERSPFAGAREAEAWLDENCVKWENAIAVRFNTAEGETMWMIGATCAS
jgi:hypothetical protein